jgi:hypothetical protein
LSLCPALQVLGHLKFESMASGALLACMSEGRAQLKIPAPNPSIERTSLSWLRQPKAAAHVERWAPAVER